MENKLQLGWLERRALLSLLAKAQRKIEETEKLSAKIKEKFDKAGDNAEEQLQIMKTEMIDTIMGKEKNKGLIFIYNNIEIDGVEVNREELEKRSVDEITEFFKALLSDLEQCI